MKKTNKICIILLILLCIQHANGSSIVNLNRAESLKKELVFLIDEGLGGKDLISFCQDDFNRLDIALETLNETLTPLQSKYKVSILIYPQWFYKLDGYGTGMSSVGLNRIHPALLHVFDFFNSKNIGIYLEMYSSGIWTNQNGELGNLPLVKKRYNSSETIKSLPLDLDCLECIFNKYDIVKGVRFHELIGTNTGALAGKNHCFIVNFPLTVEIANLCKKYDRKLIWGDHSWNLCYTDPSTNGIILPYLDKVCDILGNNLTINFGNNGWGSEIVSLNYLRNMANHRNNNKWGYSVQSWWWQEKDAQALPMWNDGKIRWYSDAQLDMPIELMAAFTLETFRRGGSLVQYEPAYYLFNFYNPTSQIAERIGQYEISPDFSGKLMLKRLIDILLNYDEDTSAYPSMNPADYYTNDWVQMMSNSWTNKPKTYNQTTLTILGDKVRVFDTYNSNVGKWYNNDTNRYLNDVFTNTVKDATRVKVDFRMIDEFLVVKSNGKNLTAEFYNYMSSYYTNCDNLVESNSDGNFLGITALNLKKNYAGRTNIFFGDPDEIVVARSNGTNINFTVYVKIFANNGATRQNFAYCVDDTLTTQVNSQFGNIVPKSFIQILGMRVQNILYSNNTRSLDNLLVVTKTPNNKVMIMGKMQGIASSMNITKIIDLNPSEILDIKCADSNCDFFDELAFLMNTNSIRFYGCDLNGDLDFTLQSHLDNIGSNSRKMLATRWTTYFKE